MPPPRLQNVRVRECSVLFFLEDGTIQAEEKRQDNSGMMQVRAQRSTAGSHWRWSAGADVAGGVRVRWKALRPSNSRRFTELKMQQTARL